MPLNSFGAALVALLAPLLGRTTAGRDRFFRDGHPLREGEPYVDHELADFLHDIGARRRRGFSPDELGGVVTAADLAAYRVTEREPVSLSHGDAVVLLNPPPAQGGVLVAHGLREIDGTSPADIGRALQAQARFRDGLGPGTSRGTTHISVADAEGNVAAMTTSNGSGSGEFAPGIGVQLNNMMGEEDLQPEGLGSLAPGTRIGSMMTPTLVLRSDAAPVAIGSGGSERIRSVMLQMVVDLVDLGLDLEEAVARPRLHWDGDRFQAEPGFDPVALERLERRGQRVERARPVLRRRARRRVAPLGRRRPPPRRRGPRRHPLTSREAASQLGRVGVVDWPDRPATVGVFGGQHDGARPRRSCPRRVERIPARRTGPRRGHAAHRTPPPVRAGPGSASPRRRSR